MTVCTHRRQASGLLSKSATDGIKGRAERRSAKGIRLKSQYAKWPRGVGRRGMSCTYA